MGPQLPVLGTLVFLFPGFLFGQFRNLVTTDDGGLLIFSSSLQLQGTDEPSWDKLFSFDSGGLNLFAVRQPQPPPPPTRVSNFYLMQDADLSGDGSVRVLISGRVCVILGSGCFLGYYFTQSEVGGVSGQNPVIYPGTMRISRSGRYGFVGSSTLVIPMLIDLNTGATKSLTGYYVSGLMRGMVASTGTVVLAQQQNSLLVVTLNDTHAVATSARTVRALVDDSALTALYDGALPNGNELLAQVDLRTGVERPLVQAADLSLVGVTNDGQVAAFLSAAKLTAAETGGQKQLFVVRADGSGLRQITQDPAGLMETTLARNGGIAYAVTAAGRLLRIDIASGTSTELIGRTLTLVPQNPNLPQDPVAGSAFCIGGTGFADAPNSAAPPLPASLGGLQLLMDGTPLPLLSVAPAQVCFQLPWDTAIGPHNLMAVTNSDPRFQTTATLPFPTYFAVRANFQHLGQPYAASVSLEPYALAVHQEFDGLVTRANAAHPGEILHFYMTGLGPVSPPVATGAAAPANPLAVITSSFSCQFTAVGNSVVTAPVLFAGLAPGTAGYYQVDVLVPKNVPVTYGDSLIVCNAGQASANSGAWIPVRIPLCPAPGLAGSPEDARRRCEPRRMPGLPFLPY